MTPLRGKKISDLTMSEVQKNFGFEKNVTHSPLANLINFLATNYLQSPRSFTIMACQKNLESSVFP